METTDWRIRYIIIDTRNWWPGEKILISPRSVTTIDWPASLLHLDLTREKIRGGPRYDPAMAVDDAYDEAFLTYYGINGSPDKAVTAGPHGASIHMSGGTRLVYLATAVSALGGLLFGYDIGVISGAILFIRRLLALAGPGGDRRQLGPAGLAHRRRRRRLARRPARPPEAADRHGDHVRVGAIGAALAPGTALLISARVVAGVAIGAASFVAPLYISELAPAGIRAGWSRSTRLP